MRLYSIQPLALVQTLFAQGQLLADPGFDRSDKEELRMWQSPYDWMASQMRKRLSVRPPAGARYPFWAWQQWNGPAEPKPDLRHSSLKMWASKQPQVLLMLDVADEEVLLSDYDAWHFVLNYWYLDKPRPTQFFEKQLRAKGLDFYRQKPLPDATAHAQMQRSWDAIFDLRKARTVLDLSRKRQIVQATFWELRAASVRHATLFGAGVPKAQHFGPHKLRELLAAA